MADALEVDLKTNQLLHVTATPDGAIDGSLQAEVVSGPGGESILPGDGPLDIRLAPGDTDGDAVFRIFADADPGSGQSFIDAMVTLHASHPLATSLGVTGVIEPKP